MISRETISPTPWHRRELAFRELNIPIVIDGKTMFAREKVSVRRMLPFWFVQYIKAPWRDFLLARENRRQYKSGHPWIRISESPFPG